MLPQPANSIRAIMPSLALALVAFLHALPAQDAPTPADLPQLRAAFADAGAVERAAIIAVVQGREPVILTAGSDASGDDMTAQTLIPLLAMAKVLAADAIYLQHQKKVDTGSGEKLGDRELTVRELLDGVPQLPTYFVIDGGGEAVDAAVLRHCGAMAAGADMELGANALGAPEFVLLEPIAFGERYEDWPSMLRSTLAPHVSGLDPVSADALAESARGRTMLDGDDLAKLAQARPAVLRTMMSLRHVGAWLQWRTQREAPMWSGARMGSTSPAITQSNEERLVTGSRAFGLTMTLVQYPTRKAAMLWIGPQEAKLVRSLQRAFEGDVFANGARDARADLRKRMVRARAARPDRRAIPALQATRWRSTAVDGEPAAQLAFGSGQAPLTLTLDGEVLMFAATTRQGAGLHTPSIRRDDSMLSLWIRPEPNADEPTKLTCVLIASRSSGAAVPRIFELVPE